jgi:hypothetical protein
MSRSKQIYRFILLVCWAIRVLSQRCAPVSLGIHGYVEMSQSFMSDADLRHHQLSMRTT